MIDNEYADTTWNLLGSQVKTYGALVIFGTAMITQLLSIFGIAVPINLMVWEYGVGMAGMLVSAIASMIWMWGMHLGWSTCRTVYEDPGNSDTDETNECDAWASYTNTMMNNTKLLMAEDTAFALVVGHYMENWLLAQWWALPEEERYAMWEEKMDEKDKDDKMYKLFAKAH